MNLKNTALVITSINEQANSFNIYDNLDGYDFILVGDRKGPKTSPLKQGRFLDISDQQKLGFFLDIRRKA